MRIALRQCSAHIWKYVRPFMAAFTMTNVSCTKSIYEHNTIKGVHMYHACALYDTVVPLYMMHA